MNPKEAALAQSAFDDMIQTKLVSMKGNNIKLEQAGYNY
jgi:hypothetical protein